MIVDDAEFMRMVIKDTLLKHGYEVVAEVGDGKEAIQTYLEVKPDLVLMDIIMPDMDGKEALQKLLVMDPEAKVVMCSSLGQQALITESMKIGAMGFIVKPFEPDGMLDVIRKIADQISVAPTAKCRIKSIATIQNR
ncbi:response regulator [Methanosarcina sp. Z-7115]|uniref:Response regulator n=1 Tax=Methanosarcina baikalica TaxID=3073890 RepID=A0ABU2CYR8_9EURY|nr:response regulator [Methanosarcina sp. Z-7115]MDR7664880.1 response regulator [Methanosarcina sp. Z-7115]